MNINTNTNTNTNMDKYIIYFKQLQRPIQFTTYIYLGSVLLYNGIGAWFDAKNQLIQYREGKLNKNTEIKNEWDAVKYGANENSFERFFNSIIWPVKTTTNIIPFIVLKVYQEPTITTTTTTTTTETSLTDKKK